MDVCDGEGGQGRDGENPSDNLSVDQDLDFLLARDMGDVHNQVVMGVGAVGARQGRDVGVMEVGGKDETDDSQEIGDWRHGRQSSMAV